MPFPVAYKPPTPIGVGGEASRVYRPLGKDIAAGYSIRCSKSRKWEVMITTFKLSLPFILPGQEECSAHSLANANRVAHVVF